MSDEEREEEWFDLWLNDETTKRVYAHLNRRRSQEIDKLIETSAFSDKADDMVRAAKLAGIIMGLNELIELSADDLKEKTADELSRRGRRASSRRKARSD